VETAIDLESKREFVSRSNVTMFGVVETAIDLESKREGKLVRMIRRFSW